MPPWCCSLQGPAFPPPYQPLPKDVKFYYDGQTVALEPAAEEVGSVLWGVGRLSGWWSTCSGGG